MSLISDGTRCAVGCVSVPLIHEALESSKMILIVGALAHSEFTYFETYTRGQVYKIGGYVALLLTLHTAKRPKVFCHLTLDNVRVALGSQVTKDRRCLHN